MLVALILLLLAVLAVQVYTLSMGRKDDARKSQEIGRLTSNLEIKQADLNMHVKQVQELNLQLREQQRLNAEILSQKKSSETRLGQISENLVPFLQNCSHDPRNMHFLGNPIDYVAFDFDEGKITFLEIKSGNSKPSRRQKTVKHIIKSGRVYYEEIRINEKGVKSKKADNDG